MAHHHETSLLADHAFTGVISERVLVGAFGPNGTSVVEGLNFDHNAQARAWMPSDHRASDLQVLRMPARRDLTPSAPEELVAELFSE